MEFNSQISTTIEQSRRLLELGVKPETADMYYSNAGIPAFSNGEYILYAKSYAEVMEKLNNQISPFDFIPAWSLHRLIELADESVEIGGFWVKIHRVYQGVYQYEEKGNDYDNLIDAIADLINYKVFSKAYLR